MQKGRRKLCNFFWSFGNIPDEGIRLLWRREDLLADENDALGIFVVGLSLIGWNRPLYAALWLRGQEWNWVCPGFTSFFPDQVLTLAAATQKLTLLAQLVAATCRCAGQQAENAEKKCSESKKLNKGVFCCWSHHFSGRHWNFSRISLLAGRISVEFEWRCTLGGSHHTFG